MENLNWDYFFASTFHFSPYTQIDGWIRFGYIFSNLKIRVIWLAKKLWSSRIWNQSCRTLAAVVKARLGVYFKFWGWGGHSKSGAREMPKIKNNNKKPQTSVGWKEKLTVNVRRKSSMEWRKTDTSVSLPEPVNYPFSCLVIQFCLNSQEASFLQNDLKSTGLRGFPLAESQRVWL